MIAVGNVIGSNICNIALVLDLSAFLQPIESDRSVVRREIPIMIGVFFYLLILSADSTISRFEGLSLFGGIILYIVMNCKLALNRCTEKGAQTLPECSVGEPSSISETSKPIQLLLMIAGIATVVVGAEFLVNAAVNMMKTFGVSEKFIGLTVVAFGTSLPELATSVVAAMKGEMDWFY
jgi:cation:H+ antiporter